MRPLVRSRDSFLVQAAVWGSLALVGAVVLALGDAPVVSLPVAGGFLLLYALLMAGGTAGATRRLRLAWSDAVGRSGRGERRLGLALALFGVFWIVRAIVGLIFL